jgi:hypothetical protein
MVPADADDGDPDDPGGHRTTARAAALVER